MKARLLAAVAVAMLCVGTASAMAGEQQWFLNGVTFDDGTSADGMFSMNVYDLPTAPFGILTTTGAIGGYFYTVGDPLSNDVADTVLDFSRGPPNYYQGYLHLVFADSLITAGPIDALMLAGASYECDNYATGGGACSGTERRITAGQVIAAEPGCLLVFGIGIAGLCLARRRAPAQNTLAQA